MVFRTAVCVLAALLVAFLTIGSAGGATSSVTVTANILSASSLTNFCTAAPATVFGAVSPGVNSMTATAPASACRIDFGSSNNSSMLRISQADGAGRAMSQGILPAVVQIRSSSPGRMNGGFAYNSLLAYTVGRSGVIRRTTNGGASYIETAMPGGVTQFDVEARPGTPDTWLAVGNNRAFRKTIDGQVAIPTWTDQGAAGQPLAVAGWPAGVTIRGISMPDATTIYLVGDSRWIAVSTNSGTSFTAFQHATGTIGNLVSVDAVSATAAVAVDDTGRELVTVTGGANSAAWTVTAVSTKPFTHVAMGAANRVYAVGQDGTAFTWDGTSWTNRTSAIGSYADIVGVDTSPIDPDTAWVVDEHGGVYRTANAGVLWTFSSSGLADIPGAIMAGTATDIFIVSAGRTHSFSNTAGASFITYAPVSGVMQSSVSASAVNGQVAASVGSNGKARRTIDGGSTWTLSTTPSTNVMFGVSLGTDTVGVAVGDNGITWKTGDGAATWQQVSTGLPVRLLGVSMSDQNQAVAVGHGGTIITTVDSGASWVSRTSGTTRTITAVAQNNGFLIAVGAYGTMLRSSDNGATWTLVPAGGLPDPTAQLVGVTMTSDTAGYAATSFDKIWKTADSGATWALTAAGTGNSNRGISAVDSMIVVAGNADTVAVSADAGTTFNTNTGATGLNMGAVDVVDTHTAYVTGQDELIERMDPSAAANALVPNWTVGTNDWLTGSFFGVCLQSVAGGLADWVVDINGIAGQCEAINGDPWQAVPTAASKVAHITAPGTATVKFVWGFKPASGQAPGTYEATTVFEALAPDV
ncbi:MAG: hypothetical protein H7123_09475 [Thermoleophilia bacterium]|nr:hypothetical protein [Thermoleophilia bacterium]